MWAVGATILTIINTYQNPSVPTSIVRSYRAVEGKLFDIVLSLQHNNAGNDNSSHC